MPQAPHSDDLSSPIPRPTLSVDWEVYAAMLEDGDLPLDQQKELIETLWSIVVMLVDLGFDLNPVQQICGQSDEALSDDPPDLVSLMEAEWAQEQHREEDIWQD